MTRASVKYHDHDQYARSGIGGSQKSSQSQCTVYLGLLKQIGTMWGTLLGLRGYTFGESFVARNVGLRTIWSKGEWSVRLIFQDHG